MQTTTAPQPPATPVVSLDGVTVIYGANRALKNVTATFRAGIGRPARSQRRRQEHDAQGAPRLRGAERRAHVGAGHERRRAAARRSARGIGYMPESDAHIPGMNAVSFVALLRPARRAAGRGRDAARARGALLRRSGRGALPQRRDVLDGHEAAHQARAGARPRSRSAVSRRADQRHGPEGARRDARARARSRAQQGRQPDPVVAPPARRRIHLRPRRRDGQGAGRAQGPIQDLKGPAGPRLRAARSKGTCAASSTCSPPRAWTCTRPTRTSCACSCPRTPAATSAPSSPPPPTFGVQVRHLRPSVPTLEDVFAKALGEK